MDPQQAGKYYTAQVLIDLGHSSPSQTCTIHLFKLFIARYLDEVTDTKKIDCSHQNFFCFLRNLNE